MNPVCPPAAATPLSLTIAITAALKRAADDPERGAEALSLLAAAYLLPGSLAPELALAHAHRAASHPAVGGEHLARCAAVALTAGDPTLAEELAGRAGRARYARRTLSAGSALWPCGAGWTRRSSFASRALRPLLRF